MFINKIRHLIRRKMKSYYKIYALFTVFVFYTSCKGQVKSDLSKDVVQSNAKDINTSTGPIGITRNITQDKKGNIWIAAFDGVFRYDARPDSIGGKSFANITSQVTSARFFSVLSDRNGNQWFGTIGAGVYYYDARLNDSVGQGQTMPAGQAGFKNFTTKDGLLNNEITCIYEDKAGNIWFGASGGASRYDGKRFQNYIIDGDTMRENITGKTFPTRQPYEVTAIVEDKAGRFWFATRGNTFVYEMRLVDAQGKPFTVFTHDSKPFKNVRSLIEDKKGNIWLGGNDGLWRFDGSSFTNFTQQFVGHIIEDKKGNIWTSSEKGDNLGWSISRYDERILSDKKPMATEIVNRKTMFFGIMEASDGSIWFGSGAGVHRYDARLPDGQGQTITDFKNAGSQ
jgi:ligand-binding sensor domain-containing protein